MSKHLKAGIILSSFALLGFLIMSIPIGLRQNNAGNIRRSTDDWEGLSPIQKGEYFTFKRPEYGYRAMAKILRNYKKFYGLSTVAEIIGRWAPASENNTSAYVAHVATFLGVQPSEPLNLESVLPDLIEVIAKHENGTVQWEMRHNRQMILDGIALA